MGRETKTVTLKVDPQLAERINEQKKYEKAVANNLSAFWENKGEQIIRQYKPLLRPPKHHTIPTEEEFIKNLKNCQVLIISANSVEGTIISHRLNSTTGTISLDAWPYEGHLFQFGTIEGITVCHIWPTNTASFTQYGSFSALEAALYHTTPKYVMSVGVAFGIDPENHFLGDVLVSKALVFYDHFNKVTDGNTTLNPNEVYQIDANLISQLHLLDHENPPEDIGDFKWRYGSMLTGGTVLSDAVEKFKLVKAAANIGYKIVGGEMEASGIYYACQKHKDRHIPFMIIKGICDWGALKNGWDIVKKRKIVDGEIINSDTVKDCVQAFACDNAFSTLSLVLKLLNYNLSIGSLQKGNAKIKEEVDGNEFAALLKSLYQVLDAYRNATRKGDVQDINAKSVSLQECMNKVYAYYELKQFSDIENSKKAKELVDLYNMFIDYYSQFISFPPGKARSTSAAKDYAMKAEHTFRLLITTVAKYGTETS